MVKQCIQCAEVKSSVMFPKNNKGNILGKCKFCKNKNAKVWRTENPPSEEQKKRQIDSVKKNHIKNKQKYSEYQKAYQKARYATDIEFLLKKRLRNRLYLAITKSKAGSAVRDIGCSMIDLRQHLEIQFQPGMSWDNYGTWHIDHIVALCKFDLSDRNQFLKACSYTNLQPLWKSDHIVKTAEDVRKVGY